MSGKEGRGVNRYMLEEVYFSKSADEGSRNIPNPQNCYYDEAAGRWYYDYPSMWYHNISGNKAIGLRKIDVFADSLFIRFTVSVYAREKSSGAIGEVLNRTFSRRFESSDNTSYIAESIQEWFSDQWRAELEDVLDLKIAYNTDKTKLEWKFTPRQTSPLSDYTWAVEFNNCSDDMTKWLNCNLADFWSEQPTQEGNGRLEFSCPDVWNREFLFLHASFVNGTSFNYLGRSGEFYPKPSKMYQAAPSSQQFYFEISFNGRTPVKFKHVSFIVDLAYIYYDKDYKAE